MPTDSNANLAQSSNHSNSTSTPSSKLKRHEGMPAKQDLRENDFSFIQKLIYERTRINLGFEKRQLVTARLSRRIRERGCDSIGSYCRILREEPEAREIDHLIDAISTNHTYFFRELNHFRFLVNQALPEFANGQIGNKSFFRAWSCACSTGEEPYSLAMNLAEQSNDSLYWRWKIECSDVSSRVLEVASKGVYSYSQLQTVNRQRIQRFLEKGDGRNEGLYRIRTSLRKHLRFRKLNLFQESFPWEHKFQVIFCRNAMIYFDRKSRQQLVNRLSEHLVPGGYLMTGHAESLTGINHPYRMIQPEVYRLSKPSDKQGSCRSF